ncbi:MAG: hypothetical protein ACE5K1_00590 [Acidiferrobacterales bacterium]
MGATLAQRLNHRLFTGGNARRQLIHRNCDEPVDKAVENFLRGFSNPVFQIVVLD